MIELRDYQLEAVKKLKSGSILCGGVGSGKSRTALTYYYTVECGGKIKINGEGNYAPMTTPKDLYIITTAKKRDSKDWEKEAADFAISTDPVKSVSRVKLVVDSWNKIANYREITGAFFIFDEQRVVGYGPWAKAFLRIARNNHWILLSATPGDKWTDYIPVFIANGFYRNKTDFETQHCLYNRYAKYPQVIGYRNARKLYREREEILVAMDDERGTVRHDISVVANYDKRLYQTIFNDRWNPYKKQPIERISEVFYLMRKVVNTDPSRIEKVSELVDAAECSIIFYNFNYELDLLREMCEDLGIVYAEWNGQKHEELPTGVRWVYLVQYAAGCEGWNCTTCDTVIFYSQSYSYRQTEQASGRIDRMNTPFHDLYYYHVRSMAPIDRAIHRALSQKKNFNESSFKLATKKGD